MHIDEIDHSFNECERYLAGEEVRSQSVERLLAHSLLILVCAEFERKIKDLVKEKSQTISNSAMQEFVQACLDSVFRSPSLANVKALLGKFGVSYKDSFRKLLDARVQHAYDSILHNRNSVAHGDGSLVTIGEVKGFYEDAHIVLDHFQEVLFADNGNYPSNR